MTVAALLLAVITHTAESVLVIYPTNAIAAAESRDIDTRYIPGNPLSNAVTRLTVEDSLPMFVGATDALAERVLMGSLCGLEGQTVLDGDGRRIAVTRTSLTNDAFWSGTGWLLGAYSNRNYAAHGIRLGRRLHDDGEIVMDALMDAVKSGVLPEPDIDYGPLEGRNDLCWSYRGGGATIWGNGYWPGMEASMADPGGEIFSSFEDMQYYLEDVGFALSDTRSPFGEALPQADDARCPVICSAFLDSIPTGSGGLVGEVVDYAANHAEDVGKLHQFLHRPNGNTNELLEAVNGMMSRPADMTSWPVESVRLDWWRRAELNALLSLVDARIGGEADGPEILFDSVAALLTRRTTGEARCSIYYEPAALYGGLEIYDLDIEPGSRHAVADTVQTNGTARTCEAQYAVSGLANYELQICQDEPEDYGFPVGESVGSIVGAVETHRPEWIDGRVIKVELGTESTDLDAVSCHAEPVDGTGSAIEWGSFDIASYIPNPLTNVPLTVSYSGRATYCHTVSQVPIDYTLSITNSSSPRRYPSAVCSSLYDDPPQTAFQPIRCTYDALGEDPPEPSWMWSVGRADATATRAIDARMTAEANNLIAHCRERLAVRTLLETVSELTILDRLARWDQAERKIIDDAPDAVEGAYYSEGDPAYVRIDEGGAVSVSRHPAGPFRPASESESVVIGRACAYVVATYDGIPQPTAIREAKAVGRMSHWSITRWPWRAMRGQRDVN